MSDKCSVILSRPGIRGMGELGLAGRQRLHPLLDSVGIDRLPALHGGLVQLSGGPARHLRLDAAAYTAAMAIRQPRARKRPPQHRSRYHGCRMSEAEYLALPGFTLVLKDLFAVLDR